MTPKAWTARCPAKINLSLRVLGRRPDGYHELDTVFQTIDLWDTLEIRSADRLTLECDDPRLPVDGSNLVLKAAERLSKSAPGSGAGAALRLSKGIPVGAGLGGGSSAAAAALMICSRLWDMALADDELAGIARDLGADVPFFLLGGTARGRGRGDDLTPLEPVPPRELLLGFPPFGIASAEVYRRLSARLTPPWNGVSLPPPSGHKWPEGKDFALAGNDLEAIVFEGWPELKRFRDALLATGARGALLSGSGSTVFGVFDHRSELGGALDELRSRFDNWTLVASRTAPEAIRITPLE